MDYYKFKKKKKMDDKTTYHERNREKLLNQAKEYQNNKE